MLMNDFLAGFRASLRHAARRRTRRARTVPALVQTLETRAVLSVTSVFTAATGALVITSDSSDPLAVAADGSGNVTLNGTALTASVDGLPGSVAAASVQSLTVNGGPGNNNISLAGVTSTDFTALTSVSASGGAGRDSITGSAFDDSLDGGDSHDTIRAGSGEDTCNGGAGIDSIDAGDGDDSVFGGAGSDDLTGGAGTDNLNGGTSNDTISGGDGDDILQGSTGNDDIDAGLGADAVKGGDGDDSIDGSGGRDRISGGNGNDNLTGGASNDRLSGDDGDDMLLGGRGNDQQLGGTGTDWMDGGAGLDSLSGGAEDDVLNGGGDDDSLDGGEGSDAVNGDDGNDDLRGSAGDDSLDGGLGDDAVVEAGNLDFTLSDTDLIGAGHDSLSDVESATITGGAAANVIDASQFSGSTTLSGGTGDDTMLGGSGDDSLSGDDGNDDLQSGSGDDDLSGGAGDDSLDAGEGTDSLSGGTADDILRGGGGDDDLDGDDGDDLLDGEDGNDTEDDGLSVDLNSVYDAPLLSGGDEIGAVSFEQSVEGDAEVELEVEIEDVADGTYDVEVSGTVVGQITVTGGSGTLKMSSNPDDIDEVAFPGNFPLIADGVAVRILSGATEAAAGTFTGTLNSELEASFTPVAAGTGSGIVKYEARGLEQQLEIRVYNLPAGMYAVVADTVTVGTITVDSDGRGRLEIETFPVELTSLSTGSIVTVGSELSATL